MEKHRKLMMRVLYKGKENFIRRKSAFNNNKNDNKRLCAHIIDMARKVYRENGCHDIVFVSGRKEKDGDSETEMDRLLSEESEGPDQGTVGGE